MHFLSVLTIWMGLGICLFVYLFPLNWIINGHRANSVSRVYNLMMF